MRASTRTDALALAARVPQAEQQADREAIQPQRPLSGGDLTWSDHAACRNADPEFFHPPGVEGPSLRQAAKAERFCRDRCPVLRQCRAAREGTFASGVWGGVYYPVFNGRSPV